MGERIEGERREEQKDRVMNKRKRETDEEDEERIEGPPRN